MPKILENNLSGFVHVARLDYVQPLRAQNMIVFLVRRAQNHYAIVIIDVLRAQMTQTILLALYVCKRARIGNVAFSHYTVPCQHVEESFDTILRLARQVSRISKLTEIPAIPEFCNRRGAGLKSSTQLILC